MNGDDLLNVLKQAVQFGLDKRFHLAGANTELEVLEGLPPKPVSALGWPSGITFSLAFLMSKSSSQPSKKDRPGANGAHLVRSYVDMRCAGGK